MKTSSENGEDPIRVLVMGTCRVRGPLKALADRGGIEALAFEPAGRGRTHTALEAVLYLEQIIDDFRVPALLRDCVSGDRAADLGQLRSLFREGIDIFVVEISTVTEFLYENIALQETLISNNLVKPSKGALLDWYRQVCVQGTADEICVEAALGKLCDAGQPVDRVEELLRGIRCRRLVTEEISAALRIVISKIGARGVVVAPFAHEGGGAQMSARRTLIVDLASAASQCGLAFFDPSQLVKAVGRETALTNGGRSTYHYSTDFQPTVADALLRSIRQAAT